MRNSEGITGQKPPAPGCSVSLGTQLVSTARVVAAGGACFYLALVILAETPGVDDALVSPLFWIVAAALGTVLDFASWLFLDHSGLLRRLRRWLAWPTCSRRQSTVPGTDPLWPFLSVYLLVVACVVHNWLAAGLLATFAAMFLIGAAVADSSPG